MDQTTRTAEYPFIQTSNDHQITISSMGISGFDGLLRIWIDGLDLFEAMMLFSDPDIFPIILREDDELTTEFKGYTVLFGVEKDYNDRIMVVIGKQ